MQDTSWKEKFPGHFERPLNSIERLLKDIGRKEATFKKEQWAVRACAKFRHDSSAANTKTALKHAWRTLRYLQPQMAASLRGNCMVYETPLLDDLESWMAETFLVETVLSVDELFGSPRPSSLPTLYYFPKTSTVLFCSSHWRIDAIGATSLMNLLFKLLAEPLEIPFVDESRNLSPGRDEAAILPHYISQEEDNAATSLLMEYTTNLPSLGLPVELVNEVFGACCRIETRLSLATTASIVAACKTKDITVTTAIHAAMLVALQEMSSSTSPGERYTSWGTFNYRPHLDPDYTDPAANPVTSMLCALPISFITSNFHENASTLKTFYAQLQDPFNSSTIHAILAPYTEKQAAMIKEPLPRGVPQPTEPLLVSLGILNRYLDGKYGRGAVEITDFWLASLVLTRQPLFYVWTWRGKMILSMCYNDRFYTEKFMRSFVEKVVRISLRS